MKNKLKTYEILLLPVWGRMTEWHCPVCGELRRFSFPDNVSHKDGINSVTPCGNCKQEYKVKLLDPNKMTPEERLIQHQHERAVKLWKIDFAMSPAGGGIESSIVLAKTKIAAMKKATEIYDDDEGIKLKEVSEETELEENLEQKTLTVHIKEIPTYSPSEVYTGYYCC